MPCIYVAIGLGLCLINICWSQMYKQVVICSWSLMVVTLKVFSCCLCILRYFFNEPPWITMQSLNYRLVVDSSVFHDRLATYLWTYLYYTAAVLLKHWYLEVQMNNTTLWTIMIFFMPKPLIMQSLLVKEKLIQGCNI